MSEISSFGIKFSRFEGIFELEKSTPRLLRQKLEEKSASYTQVYTVNYYILFSIFTLTFDKSCRTLL